MDGISMALSSNPILDMSRVMMSSTMQMTDLAHKMLKTGHEIAQIGREMGKGQLLDVSG
jgi:hypothetical protein